jgi:hypothetical protein
MDKQNIPTDYSLDFNFNQIDYIILVKKPADYLYFKVSKPLDPNYWEVNIDYEKFKEEHPFIFFSEKKFFEYIVYCLETKEFEMRFDKELINLDFTFESGRGKFLEKILFSIVLQNKKGDVSENLSDMASYVKKLENQYESFKNSIEVKFADLEEKLNLNMKNFFDKLIDRSKQNEDELKKEFKDFVDNEQRKLDIKRIEFSNEIKLINLESLRCNNIISFNSYSNNTQLFPKFINSNQNNLVLSNDSRTIEKTVNTAWIGVRCEELSSIPGIYQFSIRIDKTDNSCNIMIGYCLNTHNGASGFYNGNCLAMLYLTNGYVYCPSVAVTPASGFRAVTGLVVSATIDTSMKTIFFTINGFPVAAPKCYRINDEDISKICPCVDICTSSDKVSIVKL